MTLGQVTEKRLKALLKIRDSLFTNLAITNNMMWEKP